MIQLKVFSMARLFDTKHCIWYLVLIESPLPVHFTFMLSCIIWLWSRCTSDHKAEYYSSLYVIYHNGIRSEMAWFRTTSKKWVKPWLSMCPMLQNGVIKNKALVTMHVSYDPLTLVHWLVLREFAQDSWIMVDIWKIFWIGAFQGPFGWCVQEPFRMMLLKNSLDGAFKDL